MENWAADHLRDIFEQRASRPNRVSVTRSSGARSFSSSRSSRQPGSRVPAQPSRRPRHSACVAPASLLLSAISGYFLAVRAGLERNAKVLCEMKPRLLGVAVLIVGTMFLRPLSAGVQPVQIEDSSPVLIRKLLPTVVNVTALAAVRQPPSAGTNASRDANVATFAEMKKVGSGFIVSSAGLIVTNYHVIEGAYKIIVTLSDGSPLVAKLSHASPLIDIALLRVEAGRPLAAAHWGDSNALQVGDPVFAIGDPLGVGMTVTRGIVSALNRNLTESPFDDFIQTDAPINHGNSGGPLFDMDGTVIGVNSAIISPTSGSAGLGFAISSQVAEVVVKRLEEYGWIRPGYLGATVQEMTPEMADASWIKPPQGQTQGGPRGSIVAYVTPASPAAAAGVQVGDIILALDGRAPSDTRALLRDIVVMAPGAKTTLTVEREGKRLDLTATIAEWPRQLYNLSEAVPPVENPIHIPADLGIKVAPPAETAKHGLADGSGAVVSAVAAGTDASARGIATGDVILRVQDRAVASEAEILVALEDARKQGHDYAMFLVLPKGSPHPGPQPGPKWIALQIRQ